jgi:hypothetical protein
MHVQQDATIIVRVNNWRVTDGICATGDARFDLTQRDLVADHYCGFDTGAACALQVHGRCAYRQTGVNDAFSRQVPVFRVLDDGAERYFTKRLTFQIITVYQTVQCCGHEILVGIFPISRMRSAKWNSGSTDYCYFYGSSIVQHVRLRS